MTVACSLADDVAGELPDEALIEAWVRAAVGDRRATAHVDLRIAGAEEMAALSERFRGVRKATNVLSFPAAADPRAGLPLLGDVVLCAPVVEAEAREQAKPTVDHWAHLIVHGVLHLLGFDHTEDAGAASMEALEREILAGFEIPDPYLSRDEPSCAADLARRDVS